MAAIKDWGEVSTVIDDIKPLLFDKDLTVVNEAQTRFDVIDRIIKEVLQWQHGQIKVEESNSGIRNGFVDYILISGDIKIIIEAKRIGAAFPDPTKKKKLKLSGVVLKSGEIKTAIDQAVEYAYDKNADLIGVTNGTCWCFFSPEAIRSERDANASLFFPFNVDGDAKRLYDLLNAQIVESNKLYELTNTEEIFNVNKLLDIVKDKDARIDRNVIADFISPALDNALNGEAIINDERKLEYCFVSTDARTKFDSTLKMYIADNKPVNVLPAKRIKKSRDRGELHDYLESNDVYTTHSPVTLIIGSVGAGKSTYLKHFQLIQGKDALKKKGCHWIYVDFEEMGREGNPRQFIYEKLNEYLLDDTKPIKTDYKHAVLPAYENEIELLGKGPFGGLKESNPAKFEEVMQNQILSDYNALEPYVNKVLSYVASKHLCIIVLDNVDLYEDEALETTVFSEGIALSKRLKCNIISSIRDTTFVKHRNDSVFNAHELKKLWLDPPSFQEVLSKRLTFAREILKNKPATVILGNGVKLYVPDLSVFFEIAHTSLLSEQSGKFIESLCNGDIRKGISLVTNFLTSGHIQADRAIRNFLDDSIKRPLPQHEIFKGAVLGQWKYYKEQRAEVINLFDSKLGSVKLQLLRLYLLNFLFLRARDKDSTETQFVDILNIFTTVGASSFQLLEVLNYLYKNKLVRSTDAQSITETSSLFITQAGGYYINVLSKRIEYIESVILDTAIQTVDFWNELAELTDLIEHESKVSLRLQLRKARLEKFGDYIKMLEDDLIGDNAHLGGIRLVDNVKTIILKRMDIALRRSGRFYE
jgi:hypothetical protein